MLVRDFCGSFKNKVNFLIKWIKQINKCDTQTNKLRKINFKIKFFNSFNVKFFKC